MKRAAGVLHGGSICACLVAFLVADASAKRLPASDTVRAANMPEFLHYVGFSVRRPGDVKWFLWKSEQIPTEATLRREAPGALTVSLVKVRIGELPHEPRSAKDFVQMVRQDKIAASQHRKVLSYVQRPAIVGGHSGIEFDLRLEVLPAAPGERVPPVTRDSGYVIMHPSDKRIAVAVSFWETAPSSKFDRQIAKEAHAVQRSVVLKTIRGDQRMELGPLVY